MVSKAVVGKMLKPFVAGRHDVVAVGKSLVLLPITIGVRSVVFHGSVYEKESLWPATSAMPTHGLLGVYGRAILHCRRPEGGFYGTTDSDFPLAVWTMLNEQALPELAAIRTAEDYIAFNSRGMKPAEFPFMQLAFAVTAGDFATAAMYNPRRVRVVFERQPKGGANPGKREAALRAFEEMWRNSAPLSYDVMDRYAPGLMERFAEEGEAMSVDHKRALVAALRRLEHDNIVRAGLEPYWQKAEWPVEAMLGMA